MLPYHWQQSSYRGTQGTRSSPAFSSPVSAYGGGSAGPSLSSFPPTTMNRHDPASFRKEFTNRLAELSINSRPMIEGLFILAYEYTGFADIVAQCVESHIRRVSHYFAILIAIMCLYCLDSVTNLILHSVDGSLTVTIQVPPWMKLPAFYLLDMISKNIYDGYAGHFATFVAPLFLQT